MKGLKNENINTYKTCVTDALAGCRGSGYFTEAVAAATAAADIAAVEVRRDGCYAE
jgi:hypothetical protein